MTDYIVSEADLLILEGARKRLVECTSIHSEPRDVAGLVQAVVDCIRSGLSGKAKSPQAGQASPAGRLEKSKEEQAPIPLILTCPSCCARHIDEGEFATKSHHTHACQCCGMVWRPALVPTVGVRFLPGYSDLSLKKKCRKDEALEVLKKAADALDVAEREGTDEEHSAAECAIWAAGLDYARAK